ncbi:MAG: hypothetical protein KC486_06915 [Myxococcales bacterium]|nr:hypothetical protein [Myxococcales bacterium]
MTDRNAFLPDVEVVEASFGAYQLRPDGIVHLVAGSGEHTLELARAQLEFLRELHRQRGRRVLQVIDIRAVRRISGDARRLINSEENSANVAGAALLIDGGLSRVIGNFSLALGRRSSPIRLFNALPDALAWLRGLEDG